MNSWSSPGFLDSPIYLLVPHTLATRLAGKGRASYNSGRPRSGIRAALSLPFLLLVTQLSLQANGAPAAGGAAPAAKPGLVSLDALAKAKKALQMQKELNEKLKKLPQLQKATPAAPAFSPAPAPSLPSTTPVLNPTAAAVAAAAAAAKAAAAAVAAKAGLAGAPELPPGIPLAPAGVKVPPTAASLAAAAAAAGLPVTLPGVSGAIPASPLLAASELLPTPGVTPGVPPDASGAGAGAGAGVGARGKPVTARAPVLRLDALGREVDEEGNVVERGKIGPVNTLKVCSRRTFYLVTCFRHCAPG